MWHHKVIQKAADIVSNIKIDGILPEPTKLELIKKSIYEICKLSHASRQISKHPIEQTFGRYG